MTSPSHSAEDHCLALARGHYENFPTASFLLRSELRPAVAAVYAFARSADDYADEEEYEGRRLELLDDWEAQLDDCLEGQARGPVFVALGAAIERHQLPVQALRDLLEAFRQDVRQSRHASFEALLDYSTRSANPVGRLVLAIHDIDDDASLEASDAICTALQLTNFWQDVAVDIMKDRIYLPQDDMRRFGVSEDHLRSGELLEAWPELLGLQVARTREIFAKGGRLPRDTPGRLGAWLRLVWGGGHRILDLIEAHEHDVFNRRPTLGLADKLRIGLPALLGFSSPAVPRPAEAS